MGLYVHEALQYKIFVHFLDVSNSTTCVSVIRHLLDRALSPQDRGRTIPKPHTGYFILSQIITFWMILVSALFYVQACSQQSEKVYFYTILGGDTIEKPF